MAASMFDNKDEILLSNTLAFARTLCDTITGIGMEQFIVRPDTFVKEWHPLENSFSLHIPFFGRITGYYLISLDEQTATRLKVVDESPSSSRGKSKEAIDLLKETLNVTTGRSIAGLEQSFGPLTYLPPTTVWGTIEFPPMLSACVTVESGMGGIQCALGLDLAQLTIGKKLEEAQHKLDAVRLSQKSLWVLPEEVPGAHFSVVYKSLNEAGGDLYDVFKVDNDLYGFFVGDVSGHDISTGFVAASMRALIKQNCRAGSNLIESVQTINKVLYELLSEMDYITGCYAVLDRSNKILKVINMGHPPIVYVPREGTPRRIVFAGDVLGAFEKAQYQIREFPVMAGDRFIMYTDGLQDCYTIKNSAEAGALTFHEALAEIVREAPLESLARSIFEKMYDPKKMIRDDVIVLGVEV
jgi:hypothetical protein